MSDRKTDAVRKDEDWWVTVCSECLRASCWHMEFPCEKARYAGTAQRAASDLDALNLEHPSHYEPTKLERTNGRVVYIAASRRKSKRTRK